MLISKHKTLFNRVGAVPSYLKLGVFAPRISDDCNYLITHYLERRVVACRIKRWWLRNLMNYLLKITGNDDKVTYTVSKFPDRISVMSLAKSLKEYKSIEVVEELSGLISFPEVRNQAMINEINAHGYTLSDYGFGYKQHGRNYVCVITHRVSGRIQLLQGSDILNKVKRFFSSSNTNSLVLSDIAEYGIQSFDIKITEVDEFFDIRQVYKNLQYTIDYPRIDSLCSLYNPCEYLELFKDQSVLISALKEKSRGVHYYCYVIKDIHDNIMYIGRTDRLDLLCNRKIINVIDTLEVFNEVLVRMSSNRYIIQILTSYNNSYIHDELLSYWTTYFKAKNFTVYSDPYKEYKYVSELLKDLPDFLSITSTTELRKFLSIYALVKNLPIVTKYTFNKWKVEGFPKTNEAFFSR